MTTWNFTADSTSVIKTLQDADPPREQTFNDLSLRMVDTIIYLYEAGQYATSVKFEQIGTIGGATPTDLQDAYDKILAIIPASGGGGGQDLQSVLTEGNESITQDAIFRLDADKFLKINRASQTIEFWDLSVDAVDPISYFGIAQIRVKGSGDIVSLEPDYVGVSDGVDNLEIRKDKITFNSVDYPFPTGASSPLATLADITGGGATNLGYTPSPTNGIVTSDTGTDATLPLADTTNAGLLAPADKTKLNNTSGTNTGDNSANTNSNAYADAKVTDAIVDGVTAIAPSQNAVFDALALKAPLASPALTGTPTAPTQSANDNSTKIANTAYVDASALLRKDLVLPGKTIVVFGDSYSTGVGATNTGRGYINILKDGIGCGISNNAVQGTTIMKRTPVNYISSPNMVDNATNIPTYSEATHGLLLFEFGLNDMGQNGANYTTANFIADYQTVLTYANGTKGWPFNKILILGAPYANSTGYAAYAVLSGNAAPTTQHHLDFIEAARQVAQTNQTMFIDLYAAQVKNGVSTTMNADGYHPNDAGHFAIAKIIGNYLGYTGIFESRVPVSSSTPSKVVSGGASYSVTLGEQANMVAVFYNDGVNIAGIGESSNTQEYHIYSGGKHNFYINNVLIHSLKTTGPETTLVSTTGGLKVGYVAKTANYTIGTNDHTINCTANSFTVTLPSAITVGSGKIYCINNAGSGTITVATTSSQTIDGTTPGTLTQNHNITVMSDGANWIILSQK